MRRFALVVGLAVALLALSVSFAAGASTGSRSTVTVAPRIPSDAKKIGAVSGGASETGAVVLRPRDEDAVRQFIASVTDPASPAFHQYLAPGQYASRFGPTKATIDAVRSQLQADGLRVTSVSSDGLFVSFTGSASQVEGAFQTGLANYRLADASTGQATTGPVQLPSAIAGSVAAVVGLDNLVHPHRMSAVRAPASARGTRPAAKTAPFTHPPGAPSACANAQASAQQFGGLTDDQIAHAYGAFGLYGTGNSAPASTSPMLRAGAVPAVRPPDVRHLLLRRHRGRANGCDGSSSSGRRRAAHRAPGPVSPSSTSRTSRGWRRAPTSTCTRPPTRPSAPRRVPAIINNTSTDRIVTSQLGSVRAGRPARRAGDAAGREPAVRAGRRPGPVDLLRLG